MTLIGFIGLICLVVGIFYQVVFISLLIRHCCIVWNVLSYAEGLMHLQLAVASAATIHCFLSTFCMSISWFVFGLFTYCLLHDFYFIWIFFLNSWDVIFPSSLWSQYVVVSLTEKFRVIPGYCEWTVLFSNTIFLYN